MEAINGKSKLKALLDEQFQLFNQIDFIENDPISIPHLFTKKEDIEISGFITASISWGNRKSILNSARKILEKMELSPHEFILNHSEKDLKPFKGFVHRTFNEVDMVSFIHSLKRIYENSEGLEGMFNGGNTLTEKLAQFPQNFFVHEVPKRSRKHIANIAKGSAAKRINMFLRWMVRNDDHGVDFGLWKTISPSELFMPLDVHSGRIARKLGLLERKQDDWKAVQLLTGELRKFDRKDPVKYDFALFGMGMTS
ncbi:MAG: TIGR02757 family protein [Vicingaceae bacterium]